MVGLMDGTLEVVYDPMKNRTPVLRQAGHDWGKDPELYYHNKHFAVVRWPGGMYWSSIGSQRYSPTYWWLLKVKFRGTRMTVLETIREEKPGRRFRDCRKGMIEEARWRNDLQGG
jgi:hypothetical protein